MQWWVHEELLLVFAADISDQRAARMEQVKIKQLGNENAGSIDVRKETIKALSAQF